MINYVQRKNIIKEKRCLFLRVECQTIFRSVNTISNVSGIALSDVKVIALSDVNVIALS